jgi:hypothetical protein
MFLLLFGAILIGDPFPAANWLFKIAPLKNIFMPDTSKFAFI